MNSNSVFHICVTLAGQHECFEHVQNFCVPSANTFIPGYVHCKYVVIFFVTQLMCCILVILTVYYIIRACNISDVRSVNVTR